MRLLGLIKPPRIGHACLATDAKLDIKDRGHERFGDPKKRSPDAVGTDDGEVHWKKVCGNSRESSSPVGQRPKREGGDVPIKGDGPLDA